TSASDHSASCQIDNTYLIDRGNALDREAGETAFTLNQGSFEAGIEGILNHNRDILQEGRHHGWRVDHFGAEVRKLHGFGVRKNRKRKGLADNSRIGRKHPVYVGPYLYPLGIQGRAENRCRKIAPAATQRGNFTFLI